MARTRSGEDPGGASPPPPLCSHPWLTFRPGPPAADATRVVSVSLALWLPGSLGLCPLHSLAPRLPGSLVSSLRGSLGL